jgi:Zn finger protein HypA/HybF involved in hydrogenase expression
MDILLKIRIFLKFPLLGSKIRKEIYKTLTNKTPTEYKCQAVNCDSVWKSKKLEYNCPKCNSNKITMKLKNEILVKGFIAKNVAFFPQEQHH